jgi:hypothetical protein
MTRATRVSIELFTPPLLGASPVLFMAIITGSFTLVPVVLLVAYLVAIVPSMIFSGLMELAFSLGLAPNSLLACLLAAFLGVVAGAAMGLASGGPSAADHARWLGLIGMMAGAVTAVIVAWKSDPPAAGPGAAAGRAPPGPGCPGTTLPPAPG